MRRCVLVFGCEVLFGALVMGLLGFFFLFLEACGWCEVEF